MNRAFLLAAAALALGACTPDFDPASRIEKLRVLAVRADPPEIAPAPASGTPVAPDRATLTSFVLRADEATQPTRKTTVLYLACIPVPGDPAPSPCVALAGLRDPTGVLADAAKASCTGGGGAPPIAFAGVEVCEARTCGAATSGGTTFPPPEVVVPAGYGFDALPPGAPERILGVQAVVLVFALDATPDELAAGSGGVCPLGTWASSLAALWAAREHVLSTKRVWIRGPEAPDPPNQNPAIDGIDAGGTVLAAGATSNVLPGKVQLTAVLPPGADALHQQYTELDAVGVPITTKREEWITSWFSTAGELKELHTGDGGVEEWEVASTGGVTTPIAAVVRDLRGGVAWTVRDVTVGP